MFRRVIAITLTSAVIGGVVLVGPSAGTAAAQEISPTMRAVAEAPAMPVALPSSSERSGKQSVTVGSWLSVDWKDQTLDEELDRYFAVVDVEGATQDEAYELTLYGAGAIEAYVVGADGEVVAHARHWDADRTPPVLQWEYAAGDAIVLVSDQTPVESRWARVAVSPFEGDAAVSGASDAYPLSGQVTGSLDERDASIPFHGGHYEKVWTAPKFADPGQTIVLEFAGDDTDWLSVVVVSDKGTPVAQYPVEDGMAAFALQAGEAFVVTSQAPDDFGRYQYTWDVLPDPATISEVRYESFGAPPTYRVEWQDGSSHFSSEGFVSAHPYDDYRVEISADGKSWQAVPPTSSPDGLIREFELWDGTWQVRVVRESGDFDITSDPVTFKADQDANGWNLTSLTLAAPKQTPPAGKPAGYVDLRGTVTRVDTYRDGSTRTYKPQPQYGVQFRAAGSTKWVNLAHDGQGVVVPGDGTLRVTAGTAGRPGYMTSNDVPVKVTPGTRTYSANVATPKRSTSVGGAMVFSGTITQKYSDGSWRPAVDGSSYSIEKKSGKTWKKVHTGTVKSTGRGEFAATVPLDGKGQYRLVVGGKTVKSWNLNPATPTKTAKVAKPVIGDAGKDRYAVRVDIDQKYSDGKWGQGRYGWTYQVQYREIGSKKWHSTTKVSVNKSAPFDDYVRAKGEVEFRVKATYEGKTYYSPITQA